MLAVGSTVHLLIPSPAKKRVLHAGRVVLTDAAGYTAEFEDPITPIAESDVIAFAEINGKFMQQGASVAEVRPGTPTVLVLRRVGELVSAESRQCYRVSVVAADLVAQLNTDLFCKVVDISPEGFAAITKSTLNVGSVVQVNLEAEGHVIQSSARIQTIKELSGGRFRYGLLIPKSNSAARLALQQLSTTMQRLQLKRMRRSA